METGTAVTVKEEIETFGGRRGTIVPNGIGDGTIWVNLEGFSAPLPFKESELETVNVASN